MCHKNRTCPARQGLLLRLLYAAALLLLAGAALACGDDDDATPTPTPSPTPRPPIDSVAEERDIGIFRIGDGGEGTITIGDDIYRIAVIGCYTDSDGSSVAIGSGRTLNGVPFIAEVKAPPDADPLASVRLGQETAADDFFEGWENVKSRDELIDHDGLMIAFDADFADRLLFDEAEQLPGSVNISCRL